MNKSKKALKLKIAYEKEMLADRLSVLKKIAINKDVGLDKNIDLIESYIKNDEHGGVLRMLSDIDCKLTTEILRLDKIDEMRKEMYLHAASIVKAKEELV